MNFTEYQVTINLLTILKSCPSSELDVSYTRSRVRSMIINRHLGLYVMTRWLLKTKSTLDLTRDREYEASNLLFGNNWFFETRMLTIALWRSNPPRPSKKKKKTQQKTKPQTNRTLDLTPDWEYETSNSLFDNNWFFETRLLTIALWRSNPPRHPQKNKTPN